MWNRSDIEWYDFCKIKNDIPSDPDAFLSDDEKIAFLIFRWITFSHFRLCRLFWTVELFITVRDRLPLEPIPHHTGRVWVHPDRVAPVMKASLRSILSYKVQREVSLLSLSNIISFYHIFLISVTLSSLHNIRFIF